MERGDMDTHRAEREMSNAASLWPAIRVVVSSIG